MERGDNRVEEPTEDGWSGLFELGPELLLGASAPIINARQADEQRAIEKIAGGDVLRDPSQHDRPPCRKDDLVLIAVQLARRHAAARRYPAQGIAQPLRDGRDV